MSQTTKTIGTNVISTLSVALKIPMDRFEMILELAKGAVNYQPAEEGDMETMTLEWNAHMIAVSAGLPANEAAIFGAVVALYLHEGILEQMSVCEDSQQGVFEGELVYPATGKEGWQVDSFMDVT